MEAPAVNVLLSFAVTNNETLLPAPSNPVTAPTFVHGGQFPEHAQNDPLAGSCIAMLGVLKAEIAELDEKMAALQASATTADQKRAELNNQLEASRATSKAFDGTIASLEQRVTTLTAALPEPLAIELKPLLARLPDDPAKTRLSYSQRLQNVIGILAQTDKFNADVKYISEVKDVGGETREVQTLYLGLAAALFTDASGEYAGYGYPTASGWKWETAAGEQALEVARALDVYLARQSPEFVSVPLKAD